MTCEVCGAELIRDWEGTDEYGRKQFFDYCPNDCEEKESEE